MIVIIDNGHGEDTAGKRSPDGRLREYAYAREIAKRLQCALCHELGEGHVFLLTPETNDISLKERCQRANNLCKAHGASNALLVSQFTTTQRGLTVNGMKPVGGRHTSL